MKDPELSFVNNISFAMDAMGEKNIPTAWVLSRVSYDSVEERNAVMMLAGKLLGGGGV